MKELFHHRRFVVKTGPAVALGLVLLTLLVYWPVRTHEFVNYDDNRYVTENHHIKDGLSARGLRWALTATYAGNWHPLTWVSHMLDVTFFGMQPGPPHLVNLLFHLLNTALLFFLLAQATGAVGRSAFTAALFAVHPLHVESVAWIAERKDVLSAFFWMLTVGAYLRYIRRPAGGSYLLVLLSFALGLTAKPMLVTLPLGLLLLDYWPLRRLTLPPSSAAGEKKRHPPESTIGAVLGEKVPLLLLAAGSAVITFVAQRKGGAVSTLELYPLGTRIANALDAYALYLGRTVFPGGLAVFYPHPGASIPLWQPTAAALLLAALSAAALLFLRRRPYLAVGWFWYLVTLLPVIGLLQAGSQSLADRYTYLPLIGIFLAATWAVPDLPGRLRPSPVVSLGLAGLILALLVPITRTQLGHWRNSRSLFERALAVTTGNYLAHTNLGNVFYQEGRIEEAKKQFTEALRCSPGYTVAQNNLARVLADAGNVEDALRTCYDLLAQRPGYAKAHFNLASILVKKGDLAQATAHYREAIRLEPDYAEAYVNLGSIAAERGEAAEAIADFRQALAIRPDLPEARINLAHLLLRDQKPAEAAEQVAEVLRREPGNAEAHYLLGNTLLSRGASDAAIREYTEALRIRPEMGEARNNLGIVLTRLGRLAEAEAQYREAVRLNPQHVEAHSNLGNIFFRQGRYGEAAGAYRRALEIRASYPELHFNLAFALEKQGNDREAEAEYRRALTLKPEYAEARTSLVKLLARAR